ncbi:MAG: hypothetical protein PHT99_06170 [Methanoregula sp.]|nr:hypothetical protein [Methanoregula sp.]
MVSADGQLYTIEGVAAGLIMLITAYLVVNSTSVYTPGDTHLSDMQLEVIGSDALTMMDTAPNAAIGKSSLQTIVETDDSAGFNTLFLNTVNARTDPVPENLQFMANVTYVRSWLDNSINSTPLSNSSRPFTGTEHAVHVTKWIQVEKKFPDCTAASCQGKHAALVEVLLWRD